MMTSQKHNVNPFIKSFFNYVTSLEKEKEMANDNFNFNKVRILFELWEFGTLSAKALESELALDKGYTSRLITRLVAEGIIDKKQSSDDKRLYDITFTEKGEKITSKLYRKYKKLIMTDYEMLLEKNN